MATWVGGQFTRAEVDALIARPGGGPSAANPEDRATRIQKTLGRRVRTQLLYREAVAAGILDRPQVKALLRAIEERVLAEDWLARHAARGVQADASQVDRETQEAVARQSSGQELRRFSHIFLRAPEPDRDARSRALARAAEIRRELAEGAAFEELARRHSDSITSRGGGRVEWTPREPVHDIVAETVFSLSEGQISEPVETETGVHLFRLDGIRRPTAPDLAKIREDVKQRLDGEAEAAVIAAERERTFAASGVRLDARALSRPGPSDQVVALVGGETLRREELDWLREGVRAPLAQYPPLEFARELVVNRILAGKRRAEGIDAELEKKLDEARFYGVVDVRRGELMASVAKDVADAEVVGFYEKNRDTEPGLRNHVVDLLFFPQKGPAPAEVYARGEVVSQELRGGESFDQILERHAREPGVVVRRRLSGGDVKSLRSQSLRLGRTVGRTGVGEVSPPFYMGGETVTFAGKTPVISGKGLAFVRLVEVRPQPLEAVRGLIRDILRNQKEKEATAAIIERLDGQGGLKILVANP